jgi:hypothetical protein
VDSITISNGGGTHTAASGSVTVNPTGNTTYVGTVSGGAQSVNCQVSVRLEVPPPVVVPDAECVALTANPPVISQAGQAVTLTLTSRNANSATVNGMPIPVNGSITVNPTGNTTYVATVSNGKNSANCQTSVRLEPPTVQVSPRCIYLTANKSLIERGEEVVLSWKTEDASSITINNGGGTHTAATGSVTVRPNENTTYVATVPNAPANPNCEVSVRIERDSGGGGGGGGSSRNRNRDRDEAPRVFLDSVTRPAEPPLASVYLSEIPYTGLDLGPAGTAFYWLMLILWSAAAAYLVLFTFMPYMFRRMAGAHAGHGAHSGDLPGWGSLAPSGHGAPDAGHGAQLSVAAPAAPTMHRAAHAAAVATAMPARPVSATHGARASVYSPHEGFKSFGEQGNLTIDDIVKGLSRESGMVFDRTPEPAGAPEPVAHAATAQPRAAAPVAASAAPEAAHYSDDIVGFLEALLGGDRDRVFGTVRTLNRQGLDSEHFISQAVCALDDAYRARVEGSDVHPEVARVTADCHTTFLERLVGSLATAVDSSYSAGVTGTKLALTRALAVVNG